MGCGSSSPITDSHSSSPSPAPSASPAAAIDSPPMTSQQHPTITSHINVLQSYTLEEVAKHNKKDDCWIIRNSQVYDVTTILDSAEAKSMKLDFTNLYGKDASDYFARLTSSSSPSSDSSSPYHPDAITRFLESLHIGFIVGHAVQDVDLDRTRIRSLSISKDLKTINNSRKNSLLPHSVHNSVDFSASADQFKIKFLFELVGVKEMTHNTKLLQFLPVLNTDEIKAYEAIYPNKIYSYEPIVIAPGQAINVDIPAVSPRDEQKQDASAPPIQPVSVVATKPYCPVVNIDGSIELVVKAYSNGIASRYLHDLELGSRIETSAPFGSFDFESAYPEYDTWLLLAAGTGITPLYSIILEIINRIQLERDGPDSPKLSPIEQLERSPDGHDNSSPFSPGPMHHRAPAPSHPAAPAPVPSGSTSPSHHRSRKIILVYANRTEEDIILSSELDSLVETYPQYLSIFHVLSRPLFSPKNSSFAGHVTQDIVRFVLPPSFQPLSDSLVQSQAIPHLMAAGGAGVPGSRPRSPTHPLQPPNVMAIVQAVREASRQTSRAASRATSRPASRPTSRRHSPTRFTFGQPSHHNTSNGEMLVPAGLEQGLGDDAPTKKGVVLICGPEGFNMQCFNIMLKFGFKKGMGTHKDMHIF